MGRFLPADPLPWPDLLTGLWHEIADGTVVWPGIGKAESAERRAEHLAIFKDSRVPWLVEDASRAADFWEDVYDLLNLTRKAQQIRTRPGLGACMRAQLAQGDSSLSAASKCLCNLGQVAGKRHVRHGVLSQVAQWGLPLGLLFAFMPTMPALGFAIMLGHLSGAIFGVGIRFGPIVAASLEVTFRLLSDIGFPFGSDGNKYNELRRMRILEWADKAIGAAPHLPWDDRFAALVGIHDAARDSFPIPPIVIPPGEYPSLPALVDDPWDTIANAVRLTASLPYNALSYLVNDLMLDSTAQLSKLTGGNGKAPVMVLEDRAKAALTLQHKGLCADPSACAAAFDDATLLLAWVSSAQGAKDASGLSPDELRGLYPGLFRPGRSGF